MRKATAEKTLTVSCLAAGTDEGSSTTQREGYSPIVAQENLYRTILKDAKSMRVYGSWVEDVAHGAWLIATDRGYYCRSMIREAARNLGIWRVAKEVNIYDIDIPTQYYDDEQLREEQRERIRDALKSSHQHQKVIQAAELVLQGYNEQDAARMCGMSPSSFSMALKAAGKAIAKHPKQLPLFGEVAA